MFPVAGDLYERTFSLPIYTRMTDADVDRVIEALWTVLGR
jgi:dTDP-4-amino-4,6-dideoxygalactose transaminase